MHLTKAQERILSGEKGPALRKAMEILVALGDIFDADDLIPIHSAHVSGISIRTSGEAGLSFVEEIAEQEAEVRSPTTINPGSVDLKDWKEKNVPRGLVKKQLRMVKAYESMGAEPTCSCVPYLVGNRPPFGKNLAWSESSAVVFANSVLGARTNREGAPSALASALTGLTPKYGYHLNENRKGDVTILPDQSLLRGGEIWAYGVFGYWVGKNFPSSVPVVEGIKPNQDQLKAMGAAMATSGAIALYHVPDLTPEAARKPDLCDTEESATFGSDEFEETVAELDQVSDPELIILGCPHYSMEELTQLPRSTERKVWVCLPRKLKREAEKCETKRHLEKNNIKLIADTCVVAAPLLEMGYSSIGVNSAKAAHYAPPLAGVKVHFAPLRELLE